MLEANIRIVNPGTNLFIWTRQAVLIGADLSPDIVQRVCGNLRYKHGLAAIPIKGAQPRLLVATAKPIPDIRLTQENWQVEIQDTGEDTLKLSFRNPEERDLVVQLIERELFAQLARSPNYWSYDSPRIWYEKEPFLCKDRIVAYRRFEIGAVPIDGFGVGIAVDVSTAFFTKDSLAYFFDPSVPLSEQRLRRERFDALTRRQTNQKGTLRYDRGRDRSKCYFEQAPNNVTCATTDPMRFNGQSYTSLADYYARAYPGLSVDPDGRAMLVSFSDGERPVWVAAELLSVRVMNDELPMSLQSEDKIWPLRRRQLINGFWTTLGHRPLGNVAPGIMTGFWQPPKERVHTLPIPDLLFGNGQRLVAPAHRSYDAYKTNYRQRMEYLDKYGCYYVPPSMSRLLHIVIPSAFDEAVGDRLAHDFTACIGRWTGCNMSHQITTYDSIDDAVEKLSIAANSGIAVVVLNEEPAAYHDVAHNLERWRVKRITAQTLQSYWTKLTVGTWDKQTQTHSLHTGKKRWNDFIRTSALDVVQLMDVVPYVYEQDDHYEAMLAIDVGHDRRHFALSFLLSRGKGKDVKWHFSSHVHAKPDYQHEEINVRMLQDQIVRLVTQALPPRAKPLASLLILRDGRFCGQELQGIDRAIVVLKEREKLVDTAQVDVADLRKDPSTPIRFWETDGSQVENVLEGMSIELNAKTVVMTATGRATLTQATADPYVLVSPKDSTNLIQISCTCFTAAQINYSSPSVAQRLPLPLKRVDDDLTIRASQEVKRLR